MIARNHDIALYQLWLLLFVFVEVCEWRVALYTFFFLSFGPILFGVLP